MAWCCAVMWNIAEALLLFLAVAVFDIWRRGYAKTISWPRLIWLWTLRQLSTIKIYRVYRQFEKDVRNFDKVQSDFLLGRIRSCENTAYGRDHGFSSVRTVADFRRTQPVTEYSYYHKYVERVADEGDKQAMLGEEDTIHIFTLSSGTTGTNKRIPVSVQGAEGMQKHMLHGAFMWTLRQKVAPWSMRRLMNVTGGLVPKYTKAGYYLGSVSTVTHSKMGATFQDLYTSPAVSSQVKTEFESQYIHLLFGLRDKHICTIICIFVHNFLSMMKRLQVYQKDLVNDVRRGRIKEDLNIPAEVRATLNMHLTPMPNRADEVEREISKDFDGIVTRLWPEVSRVSSIWSGSTNEMYYREARRMIGPNIPVISFSYLASEGMFGMNMEPTRPGQPLYTLVPDTNFYEFLPICNDQIPDLEDVDPKQLLLATELEIGKVYEMYVSNASGFYRYREGDVVRVVGFYQQAPKLEFLYRSGQSLNVNGERLSEDVLFRALRTAAERWSIKLTDYTVAGSQFGPDSAGLLDPHYLVFIEAEGGELTDEQLAMADSTLVKHHEHYANYRKLGKISPMKVYQVPTGTFARFKQHLLDTTPVTSVQFKMPRVLKSRDRVNWFFEQLKK